MLLLVGSSYYGCDNKYKKTKSNCIRTDSNKEKNINKYQCLRVSDILYEKAFSDSDTYSTCTIFYI